MPTKPDRQARQIRSIPGSFQTRTLESGEPVIEGYFAVFNSDYFLWPGATERVAPGAFADELHADVRALCDHDTRIVLGRKILPRAIRKVCLSCTKRSVRANRWQLTVQRA